MKEDSGSIATAVALATATAKQATDVAYTAVKTATDLAAKTAETNGTIMTNMEWFKKSLTGIELTLNEMRNSFVTSAQHSDVLTQLKDHETRINQLETERTRTTVLLSAASVILSTLIGLLVWHLFQK